MGYPVNKGKDVLNNQTLGKRNPGRPTPQISMLEFKNATYALGGFEFKVHSPVHPFSKATLKFGGGGPLFDMKCLIILYINSILLEQLFNVAP